MNLRRCVLWATMDVLAGCSGGSADDQAGNDQASGAATAATSHGKATTFECSAIDNDFTMTELSVTPGTVAKFEAKFSDDQGSFAGEQDPKYKPKTSANKDYVRVKWSDNDPWQDSGFSWLLVHKDVLSGKKGDVKFQVSGETFSTSSGSCAPK